MDSATSANPLQRAVVSPPDYDYIKIDAVTQDVCYCTMNLLTCCMLSACVSPRVIRIKNRMANRGWDFVGDSASTVPFYRTLQFRRRRDAASRWE